MRLLIADDENLTREGLLQSIDWPSLGISEILQADDGQNGLALARKSLPDIVLTDVRMPRMSGIEMSERIQQLNPDCPIIFMSGYSDKEYLKAAIKLRAVRYVEKPIDTEELIEAIQEAVRSVSEKQRQNQTYELFQKEAASQLALWLTRPDFTFSSPKPLLNYHALSIGSSTCFSTLILKFHRQLSDFAETDLSFILQQLDALVKKRGFRQVHTLKNEAFLIMHIYGSERISSYVIACLCKDIHRFFTHISKNNMENTVHSDTLYLQPPYIVAGKTVTGPEKVSLSYRSAVILLQNAFFYPNGSILIQDQEEDAKAAPNTDTILEQFPSCLLSKDAKSAYMLAQQLYKSLLYQRNMLPTQAKDIYYKLLMHINTTIYQLKLSVIPGQLVQDSPMGLVTRCSSLDALSKLLTDKLGEFEELLSHAPSENSTVFLIRDYIEKRFGDNNLSIKEISEHVHLSCSYICTMFKTETGQTLNQYITEYRIEKAKMLLADPRNKITEISSRVGYTDGNYFSKSFKKAVGLSPSEYRERELS